MNPPQNIEELLKTFKDIDVDNVEKSISDNYWSKKFHNYLVRRSLDEDVVCFIFLLKMEAFTRLQKSEVHKRSRLFRKIVTDHFHEDCDNIVPLSNGQVSDYLTTWANERFDDKVNDSDIEKLLMARNDPTVLSEGLEPTFQKFAASNPSTLACLLSIL